MTDIINRVTESGLISLDLADYKPTQEILGIDISEQLWQGLVLKEKDFREALKNHDWSQFQNHFVAIHCSTDAIIPAWASILVTVYLSPFAKKVVVGNLTDLETSLYQEILSTLDYSKYQDKPVILKGCSDIPCPDFAMVELLKHLQPVVKTLMYGEPCSTVPIYKRK